MELPFPSAEENCMTKKAPHPSIRQDGCIPLRRYAAVSCGHAVRNDFDKPFAVDKLENEKLEFYEKNKLEFVGVIDEDCRGYRK